MKNINVKIKAEAIRSAISLFSGVEPEIIYTTDGKASILFTEEQAATLRKKIEEATQKPSDIKINLAQILGPLLLKKAGAPAAAVAAGTFLIGYLFGKK